jgi:hypothetical protein
LLDEGWEAVMEMMVGMATGATGLAVAWAAARLVLGGILSATFGRKP